MLLKLKFESNIRVLRNNVNANRNTETTSLKVHSLFCCMFGVEEVQLFGICFRFFYLIIVYDWLNEDKS